MSENTGCSDIISDALMRSNKMKCALVIFVDEEGAVVTNYSCTRVERLGMLTHVLFHELARSVKEVDEYESEDTP